VESIRYVALGDSYTIGTGLADVAQNFPSLLASRLREESGMEVALLNLGVNGYTTADLIREELPVARGLRPELVSILIGANDVVQGSGDAAYRTHLAEIYETVEHFGLAAKRVLVVSIPDFAALPGAAPFGAPSDLGARIGAFNRIAQSEAASRGFAYVDITAISREDKKRDDWLAPDGLHPGPAQHQAIADRIETAWAGWRSVQYNRWSPSARRVLGRAQDEAKALHHANIGTEHLLLGLVGDSEGTAGQLLKRRQVTYRRVRKIVDQVLGKSNDRGTGVSQIIPTTRVRQVLRIACQEARAAGADSVGTEHILLALMVEGGGIAPQLLSDLGVTLTDARADIVGMGAG
jgi:lysophospholipase L1-like esterase